MEKVIEYRIENTYLAIEEAGEDFIIEMGTNDDREHSNGFMVSINELKNIVEDLSQLLLKVP